MEVLGFYEYHKQAVCCWQIADREEYLPTACIRLLEDEKINMKERQIHHPLLPIPLSKLSNVGPKINDKISNAARHIVFDSQPYCRRLPS